MIFSSIFVISEEPTCLDQVMDYSSGGVQKHLGRIADLMSEWEGSIADQLGLTPADVAAINTKHPSELRLQMYVHIFIHYSFKELVHWN